MAETTARAGEAQYAPGSYGCHEAMHMAAALAAMVERELAEHPAVAANLDWKAFADRAVDVLNSLYQAIGAQHLGEVA